MSINAIKRKSVKLYCLSLTLVLQYYFMQMMYVRTYINLFLLLMYLTDVILQLLSFLQFFSYVRTYVFEVKEILKSYVSLIQLVQYGNCNTYVWYVRHSRPSNPKNKTRTVPYRLTLVFAINYNFCGVQIVLKGILVYNI